MTRRTAATHTLAAAAAAVLLGSLSTIAPAQAERGHGSPSALGTHLRYTTTTWTGGGVEMSIVAPRSWSFVTTPEGQARFNDEARHDVMSMGYRGTGSLRHQVREQVAALQGTPGLHVVGARVRGRGESVTGDLRYRWTPRGGVPRWVHYRYQGDDAYAVAGRLIDRRGLEAVLATAAATGECS